MAGKRGGGLGDMVMKVGGFLLACGLLLAVMRVFNWDPFGVVTWLWDWFALIVNRIADFFTGNDTFRKATSKPS